MTGSRSSTGQDHSVARGSCRFAAIPTHQPTNPLLFSDVLTTAFTQIKANPLRSFFTLVGIIVSVAFLVAVVAVIQGMNSYVTENIANAMVGSNAFQVRRTPINIGLLDDDELLLRSSKRSLERNGRVVHTATNRNEALVVVHREPIDLASHQ